MDKKEAYEKKMEAQLDEWNARIDMLKAKAAKAEADSKIELQDNIDELQKKRQEAEDKLQELRNSSSDAWEDLKDGVEKAWSDFGAAVKSATSRFD